MSIQRDLGVALQLLLSHQLLSRIVYYAMRWTFRPWKRLVIAALTRAYQIDLADALNEDPESYDILAAINALRVSPKTDMRIEVDAGLTIFIPKKPDPKAITKPNPLTLIVNVNERFSITLNGETEGSFPDTSKLEQHLKQIFKAREENGVWRQGTKTTETTVGIRLDKNMTFTDLIILAQSVKRAGSGNIGLQVDETNMLVEMELTKP